MDGLRGRPALRHHGPARQRPAPRCTSTTCACPPENVLGEPGDGFRIAMHILNNGRMSLGTGSVGRRPSGCSNGAIEHVERARAVRPAPGRLRARRRRRSAGWWRSSSGSSRWRYLTTGLVDPACPTTRSSRRWLQGRGHGVPLVPGQPRAPAQGRRGLHARPALREGAARHPHLPHLRGRQRRAAAPSSRSPACARWGTSCARWASSSCATRSSSLGVLAEYVGGRVRREIRPDRLTMPTPSSTSWPRRSATRSSACVRSASACCARHGKDIDRASSRRSAVRRRWPTSRPDRGALARDARSSRSTAPRSRARSATSPRPSAPAPPAASRPRSTRSSATTTTARWPIAKMAYRRGAYGYALFED